MQVKALWIALCLVAVGAGMAGAQSSKQADGGEAYGPRKEQAAPQRPKAGGWGLSNWKQDGSGRRSAPLKSRGTAERVPWPKLKPEQCLINVNGQDVITYGAMLRHAQLAIGDMTLPPGVTMQEFEAERDAATYKSVLSFARNFITKALFAQEARKKGITLTKEEVDAKREELLLEVRSKRKNPADSIKEFETPGSYFQSDLTNTLLFAHFRKEVIRPSLRVMEEDIEKLLKEDADKRQQAAAKNAERHKLLEETLEKIKKGENFVELAREVSACESASDGGEFGTVKRDDILPQLADVLWGMEEGQVYDKLVETPYSWHILKLNKKNRWGTAEDGKEPPVITVNFSHIVLEKIPDRKPMTRDEAQTKLLDELEEEELSVLIEALLADARIETPLPLYPKK